MKEAKKKEWITVGYQMVSEMGFGAINIEQISRVLKKNKSSFYYYFGDKEGYLLAMLDYHLLQIKEFALKVENCKNVRPDFVEVLFIHKDDMLFHKQLRIQRDNNLYKNYIEKGFEMYFKSSVDLWVDFFDLPEKKSFVKMFIFFFAENFLLRIVSKYYTRDWLNQYFEDLYNLVKQLKP